MKLCSIVVFPKEVVTSLYLQPHMIFWWDYNAHYRTNESINEIHIIHGIFHFGARNMYSYISIQVQTQSNAIYARMRTKGNPIYFYQGSSALTFYLDRLMESCRSKLYSWVQQLSSQKRSSLVAELSSSHIVCQDTWRSTHEAALRFICLFQSPSIHNLSTTTQPLLENHLPHSLSLRCSSHPLSQFLHQTSSSSWYWALPFFPSSPSPTFLLCCLTVILIKFIPFFFLWTGSIHSVAPGGSSYWTWENVRHSDDHEGQCQGGGE